MMRLQPKLKRIREKYQDYNPQERQQKIQMETSELYQKEGYSSMGASCLPLLLQFPVLIGLYGVIQKPLTYVLNLSSEVITAFTEVASSLGLQEAAGKRGAYYVEPIVITNIEKILEAKPEFLTTFANEIAAIRNFDFRIFGIDLGVIPSNIHSEFGITKETIFILAIPVLSGIASMLTSVLTQVRQKKTNPDMQNQQMMGCMMFMMPLWSVYLCWNFPVGMGMYWILSSLIAFFQTLIIGHFYAPRKVLAKSMVEETINRRAYEKMKLTAKEKAEIED